MHGFSLGSFVHCSDGAFRRGLQARRRIDSTLSDLREYFHFRSDHRLVGLRHSDSRTAFGRLRLIDPGNVSVGTLMDSYQIGDRRPLASRGWKISEKIARWLAERGATPNAISIAGMLCGITAGIMFFETARVSHPWIFWLGGAVLVQLRLLANLYDGMVAVLRQVASPVGELFNEVPDRVSDAATLIGFGYAAGSDPLPGFVATIFAIFLAYLRAELSFGCCTLADAPVINCTTNW